jgi:hypothetical protein
LPLKIVPCGDSSKTPARGDWLDASWFDVRRGAIIPGQRGLAVNTRTPVRTGLGRATEVFSGKLQKGLGKS